MDMPILSGTHYFNTEVVLETENILASLGLELRRGTIVLCVLSRLQAPMYGYSLITALANSGIQAEANTLYPLLRRLEGQGLLQSKWETGGSKPRKYYTATPLGRHVYEALKTQWNATVESVQTVLQEETHEQ
ncbi:MAG: PadR family transcriptional regulator [Oscillospiraceae bacterium]